MKTIILFLLCLFSTGYAKSFKGANDYGLLLDEQRFTTHCKPFEYKNNMIYINGHESLSCADTQELLIRSYNQIASFISNYLHKVVNDDLAYNVIYIRVVTLAELNNQENFSNTEQKCMYNFKCDSGAYFGRTFYAEYTNNFNVYVVDGDYTGNYSQYSFVPTFKHELMHVILNKYALNSNLTQIEEHKLIYDFLEWIITNSE